MCSFCGVYEILNTVNGKRYIGSSVNIELRRLDHQARLRNGSHVNIYLQRAWIKHGEENFAFAVRFLCSPQDVIGAEQGFIDYYGAKNLYNLYLLARSSLGYKHSEETKRKMSQSAKGKIFSSEHRSRIGHAHRGKFVSTETRERQSRALKNPSIETREKIGRAKSKSYSSFISPDGTIYPPGRNLREFCRKHKLSPSNMWSVKVGRRRHCEGWRLYLKSRQ